MAARERLTIIRDRIVNHPRADTAYPRPFTRPAAGGIGSIEARATRIEGGP
ncbi:hypothetical protein [Haloterrigena sp. H1]|uniref:hypothetical protein n=1 Tax=Haloterrigena sp. H1 TaxID=2552943 RepID=UPI0014868A0F|nr:hypothetical protein [Haloterrigena sp. H1]